MLIGFKKVTAALQRDSDVLTYFSAFAQRPLHRISQWWYMSHGRKREAERQEQGVGLHQKRMRYSEGQPALSLWLYTVFDQELGSSIIKLWPKDMGGMRTHYPVSGCSAKL